jgi:hypothetical protein
VPDQTEASAAAEATAPGGPATATEATAPEAEKRISPWWLLAAAVAAGAVLTALADLVSGGDHLSAIEWLGTTVGVAALVVAVGIYRLQERSGNEAHAELMDQLEAQNELLNDFAKREAEAAEEQKSPEPPQSPEVLTDDQRAEIESRFGPDSIASAIDPRRGRNRGGALLVRLHDGRLVSVYDKHGRTYVREVGRRGEDPRRRPPR